MWNKPSVKVGDVFTNNQGSKFTVVEYTNANNLVVEFNDKNMYQCDASVGQIKRGVIKNPFVPNVLGVGFLGEGDYAADSICYSRWTANIKNGYIKYGDEFCDFQIFAAWVNTKSGDWKNLGDIAKYSENLGFVTKDMIRLEKSNPMPRNRDRRYITDYECAIWFTMPKAKWIFNRQDDKYQRPKFVHSIDKGLHPTQKSLKLMGELVKIHSNEGQTVLDCFAGSGTTGVACKNLKRRFIGIELDEKYFNIAKERIEST